MNENDYGFGYFTPDTPISSSENER